MALKESLLQSWFDAAWARDGIALLRENGLLPEGVTAAGFITPLDAVLQAILAFLDGLPSLSLIGEADAAEIAKAGLPTPSIPEEKKDAVTPEEWHKLSSSLDAIPGMTGARKYYEMLTAAFEGGLSRDEYGEYPETAMGLSDDIIKLEGYTSYLVNTKLPSRLNKNLWEMDHFNTFIGDAWFPEAYNRLEVKGPDGRLVKNGYQVMLETIPNKVMGANVNDVLYNRGSMAGGGMLNGLVDEFDGAPNLNYNKRAYVTPHAIRRIGEISRDPKLAERLLERMYQERVNSAETNHFNGRESDMLDFSMGKISRDKLLKKLGARDNTLAELKKRASFFRNLK
ncbi:MAG: hypothetical protein HQL51_08875 [Magnetococcales bacterium]|nr:hypothetical protein [Magnetococcales bacterium]